jgi:hypothetical protein
MNRCIAAIIVAGTLSVGGAALAGASVFILHQVIDIAPFSPRAMLVL